jgi:hypothetical protein
MLYLVSFNADIDKYWSNQKLFLYHLSRTNHLRHKFDPIFGGSPWNIHVCLKCCALPWNAFVFPTFSNPVPKSYNGLEITKALAVGVSLIATCRELWQNFLLESRRCNVTFECFTIATCHLLTFLCAITSACLNWCVQREHQILSHLGITLGIDILVAGLSGIR